tara:strand:- start:931 stop:1050 length:120 start_codon:yes stop_codon:yes gene_type:complete
MVENKEIYEMKTLLTPLLLLLFVANAAADFPDVINTNEV